MARHITQSAIREVRDQLMLDTADGSYLNIVTSNVGLERPKYGLSDDEWRAIAKVLGLSYKQIRTKFEELLSIIYGPKTTLVGSLKTAVAAGEPVLYLQSTEGMPQVGTLILDKGLPNEETITYSFIDRTNNAIYLDTLMTYGHVSCLNDIDRSLIVDRPVGSTNLILTSVDRFPTTFPFSLLLDRGTAVEETVTVTAADRIARTLTCSPTVYAHVSSIPSSEYSTVRSDYVENTYMISAADISAFPEEGEIFFAEPPVYAALSGNTTTLVYIPGGSVFADTLIGRKVIFHGNATSGLANVVRTVIDNADNSVTLDSALPVIPAEGDMFYIIDAFTATGGTVNSVSLGATFTSKELTGYKIVFVGNSTPALQGVSRDIESNTTTQINFSTALGSAPVAGDVFYILPKVEYTRASYTDNVLVLKRAIYSDIPKGMKIELLKRKATAALAQVQITGTGWDVFQVDPRLVEILIPGNIEEPKNLRTASFLHDKQTAVSSTTLSSLATAGDSSLSLTSLAGWPMEGVVVINALRNFGFARRTVTDRFMSLSSDKKTVTLQTGGLTVNSLVGQDVIIRQIWSGTVVSNTANTITFSQIIPNNTAARLSSGLSIVEYIHPYIINLLHETVPAGGYAAGVSASLYQPVYAATDLISGNFRSVNDTYPGPYLYDEEYDAPTNLQNLAVLSQNLAGPTRLVMSQTSAGRALEVEDASFFPLTGFPYSARLGGQTGSSETVEVTGVHLRQQVGVSYTPPGAPSQVTISAASIGDIILTLTTTGGTQNSAFPNANGYRVLIGRGVNEEVAWITSVLDSTHLSCEALTKNHSAGETIELLYDVVTVSSLTNNHVGCVSTGQKKVRWPDISSTNVFNADSLQVQYSSIAISSAAGLDPTGDSVILNFGNKSVSASSKLTNNPSLPILSTTFVVEDATVFPQPSAAGYPMVLGQGTANEETVFVTNIDASLDEITILRPTQKIHYLGDRVAFVANPQEIIEYSNTVGNTLSFSSPIMLQSNHHINEPAIGSEAKSIPKENGFDFPFRMPPNLFDQLYALFDMVRAAGVQVTIIEQR